LAGILSLKPEDEKSLHPEAVRWFNDRRAEIQFEVPLEDLCNDDLNNFLSDDEKREFIRCKDEITRGLVTCINMDEASHDLVTNANMGLTVLRFQVDSLLPISRIGLLLKCVHQRKVAKAKQEQRERDEEDKRSREQGEAERRIKEEKERWQAARKAVSPPIDDAKRYLDDEEYDKFIQAALDVIEVYQEKGEDYLDDSRTFDYRCCLKKINDRKEEERQKIVSNIAAKEYNRRLNDEKMRLKALLCSNKRHLKSYFEKEIKGRRYMGENFSQFLSSEEEKAFDNALVSAASRKLDNLVSNDFHQFIDGKYLRSYFLLPSAEYSLDGVPCLDFMFDVFAVVETRVWLKPGRKTFGDYPFNLPWRQEKVYPVLLKEPELLGYHYFVLSPEALGGYMFWQTIPLLLLKGLLNGETRPNGTTISAASDGMITYKIPKFKEEVTIPDSFAGYLKNIGSIDQMVSMGIITEKVGDIVKSELDELKVEQKVSLSEEKVKQRDSKKAKAFQLFDEGKRPSDSEVKSLGIKPNSAYRYYQEWKNLR